MGRREKARIEDHHLFRVSSSPFPMFSIFLILNQFLMMFLDLSNRPGRPFWPVARPEKKTGWVGTA